MSNRKEFLWMATGPLALIVVAVALLLISDSTPARAVAFALFGIACVIAISLVFFVVGRSEDVERAAQQPPPPPPPDDKPPHHEHEHERPAAARRRRRPPRRPT